MAVMIRKAPTLAWILAGLTCFLVGVLTGAGWSQAASPPILPNVGVVVTVEVVFRPTDTPVPTPRPEGTRTPTPDWTTATPASGSGGGNVR